MFKLFAGFARILIPIHIKEHAVAVKELMKGLKKEHDKISTTFPADTVRNAIYIFQLFFPEVAQAIREVKSQVVSEIINKQMQLQANKPQPSFAAPALIGTISGTLKVKNLIRAPQAEFPAGHQPQEAVKGALDLTRGWREIQQQYPNQNARLADNVNAFEAENIVEEPIVRMTALPPPQKHWSLPSSSSSTSPYTPAYLVSKASASPSNATENRADANNALRLPEGITLSADGRTVNIDVDHFEDEAVMTAIQKILQGKRGVESDYYESHHVTRTKRVDEITFVSSERAEYLIKELNRMVAALTPSASPVASLGNC